jgi:6-methylsalicylate decarboxylase
VTAKNAESLGKVDVHAHMIPDFYVREMKRKGIQGALWSPFPKWNPEIDRRIMKKNGIAKRILSLSIPGVSVDDKYFIKKMARTCNQYAATIISRYPDLYGAFATLPFPEVDSSLSEIEYAMDVLKLDGVTFFSNVDGNYYGEDQFEEIFSALDKRKAIVFLHPNDLHMNYGKYDILEPIIERMMDTGRSLAYLFINGRLSRYTNIRYIVSHGGGSFPLIIKSLENNHKLDQEMYTAVRSRIYYDTAQQGSVLFTYLKNFCGSEQLLIGSDGGWQNPIQVSQTIRAFDEYPGFTDQEKQNIEYANARKLFPRLKCSQQ